MSRWNNKEEFISWVQGIKDAAVQKTCWGDPDKGIDLANASVNMRVFKDNIDNEVLDILNEYYEVYNIEIFYLYYFFLSLEEYRFFQSSGVRERADKFNEDIAKLKAQADHIRKLSLEPFTIRLPKRPEEIVHGFVTRWRDFSVNEAAIDEFCKIFGYKTIQIDRKIKSEIKFFKENDIKNRPRFKTINASENPIQN